MHERNNQKIKFDDSAQEERTGAEENLFIVLLLPLFIFVSILGLVQLKQLDFWAQELYLQKIDQKHLICIL